MKKKKEYLLKKNRCSVVAVMMMQVKVCRSCLIVSSRPGRFREASGSCLGSRDDERQGALCGSEPPPLTEEKGSVALGEMRRLLMSELTG